jgi:pimeloyl-ACP methyl ester carboxylesterase
MADDLRHGYADVDRDVQLHYVELGSGPLVVLLHGFPAFWLSWRAQLEALAAAGFRAVAVDLRGYNLSSKPRRLDAYRVGVLGRDVRRLIEQLGAERAHVVGHDWGGGVAWAFAMQHGDRLDRLVILNAPHPGTFARQLLRPTQLRKSWYMFFFQLPWLPERLLAANQFGVVRRELDDPAYVEALRQPGALTTTINYYRAMFRGGLGALRNLRRRVDRPVLVIWGEDDRFLGRELAELDPRLVPDGRVVRLPGVGHWPQLEAAASVNALLVDFLATG